MMEECTTVGDELKLFKKLEGKPEGEMREVIENL
jgi:hypothetical protein